jgi:hypothetical protein
MGFSGKRLKFFGRMVDTQDKLFRAMRFYIGQYVTRNDQPGIGVLGRIVRVRRRTIKDSAGSRYAVRVRWANGYIASLSGAQLRVVCPTCAGLTKTFSTEQCERQKKECHICNEPPKEGKPT